MKESQWRTLTIVNSVLPFWGNTKRGDRLGEFPSNILDLDFPVFLGNVPGSGINLGDLLKPCACNSFTPLFSVSDAEVSLGERLTTSHWSKATRALLLALFWATLTSGVTVGELGSKMSKGNGSSSFSSSEREKDSDLDLDLDFEEADIAKVI